MTDWADVKVLAAAAAKLAGPGRRVVVEGGQTLSELPDVS